MDSIWRRWLRPESAVTFPGQAARFQGVGHQPAQNLLSSMDQMRLLKRRLLSRPAPFCKDQSPRIGSTTKQLANLSASLRSGPGGITRASSRASAARLSQSSLSGERCVSLLIALQCSRCLDLLSPLIARLS